MGRQPVEDILQDSSNTFELGKANIIKDGTDITIFSTGCILSEVLNAASLVQQKRNISVRVVNVPTIKPIDTDMVVKCSKETKHLFSVEDHSIVGGLGSAISEVLCEENPTHLKRIGLNDEFPESAAPKDLYEFADVVRACDVVSDSEGNWYVGDKDHKRILKVEFELEVHY